MQVEIGIVRTRPSKLLQSIPFEQGGPGAIYGQDCVNVGGSGPAARPVSDCFKPELPTGRAKEGAQHCAQPGRGTVQQAEPH